MDPLPSGTVTFLFTDIEDSTRLWQEQPVAMARAHARHDQILQAACAAHHGHVFQVVGDSFSVAFHNAYDGLEAALTAQRRLASGQSEPELKIRVRMGLHTGSAEVLADGKYDGYVTLASAQRVMSVAHGGQILLSQAAADLLNALPELTLRDLGEHQLKSLRAPLRLYQVCAPDLPQEFPPLQTLTAQPHNLPPQLTSFVGRETQLAEAARLLDNTRVLTLIGPGGTGKTRLSLQLAEQHLPVFPQGIWFIDLAPLSDPAYVVSTLATVLGLHEVQGLSLLSVVLDYLRGKQVLLILDNCEHLVEASARLADQLLHECPLVKILASSREALGIQGETIYRVPSLKEGEAARLFIERASRAGARFEPTADQLPAIAQICERLDGIPLAIELAAARVKLFTPQQIAERLDDRFKLLTGGSRTALPRQQTLRALIDWSYQTLNETEQRTLRQLSVFAGGWTFEAAEAVVGADDVLEGLAGLVNKSLVNAEEEHGRSRYFFLETIRQYAMEKLAESGEAAAARTRHLDYMLGFARPNWRNLADISLEWLDLVDSERDNLRAALEWSSSQAVEKAIELALRFGSYWSTRDHISEALHWYETILHKSEARPDLASKRAAVYSWMGWTSILVGRHREGRAAAEAAIQLAGEERSLTTVILSRCTLALASVFLGDPLAAGQAAQAAETLARERGSKEELALALSTQAQVAYFTSRDQSKVKGYFDQAIQVSHEVGYRWETAFLTFGQARLAAQLGDLTTARLKFEEGAAVARQLGNKRMVYSFRSETAHALREHGLLDEALAIYLEVVPGWRELGHRAAVAHELECIGYVLRRREEPERAASLLSAAQTLRRQIDMPRTQREDLEYQQELAALRDLLGEETFQQHWVAGQALSMDEAIQWAVGSTDD